MPASGTLYSYADNFRASKALIAAKYSGASVTVAKDFVFGETNKTDAFLAKFPLGKVPAFESKDGVCLFESNAIAHYVANEELRGKDAAAQALVQQWVSWADCEVQPSACTWVFQVMGVMGMNKSAQEKAKEELKRQLNFLNSYLLHSTFLVGERVTLADIAVACTLLLPFQQVFDGTFRKAFPNVTRWFQTCVNQPQFKSVLGEVKLCEKVVQAAPLEANKNKEKKKDVKKAAPKKEAPKEEEPMDDGLSMPKSKTDPLSAMPKGTWDMDDFKRFYSNNDEDKSIPYFFEKFDPANYSIWRCDYKYSDELAMVFMSCNLIGGMYQRLEKLRKNAFASVALFGEDNNSTISGIWVWRGQDLAFEQSEDWKIDYNSYSWEKLDASKPETKKMVTDYFRWEGKDKEGRKFNQGKIFK